VWRARHVVEIIDRRPVVRAVRSPTRVVERIDNDQIRSAR
jgi:hypothetical protein